MALTDAQLKADQAQVFADFPTEAITIGGAVYQCLSEEDELGTDWAEAGGEVTAITIRVAIERGAIDGAIPAEGDTVTFRGTSYRLGRVEKDDPADSVHLNLIHTNVA